MKINQIIKIIILVIILIILALLTLKLLPLFKELLTEEGRIIFKERIEGLGIKGAAIIIIIMFAQVFLAILPGEPIEILAGMCFGPIGGMLVLFLGTILSSALIFYLVKKFGRKFIYSFVSEEKIEKIENSKIFSNKKKIYTILFILFVIPGTPKDLFTYMAGLLPINPIKFLIITTIARIPSVISSTIVGSNLLNGKWYIILIVYIITLVTTIILMTTFKNKEKNTLFI